MAEIELKSMDHSTKPLLHAEEIEIPFRPLQRLDPRVQRCVWELNNNPMSHRFAEADLARFAGIGVAQLNRLFQAQFGQTSGAWMNRTRLEKAKHLLTTPAPIKEIAFNLGFCSPQHFASWFRKQIGQTPSAWRKGKRSVP